MCPARSNGGRFGCKPLGCPGRDAPLADFQIAGVSELDVRIFSIVGNLEHATIHGGVHPQRFRGKAL